MKNYKIFNPLTEKMLNAFIKNPVSSLIIEGDHKSGVDWAKDYIVEKLLSNQNNQFIINPDEKNTISIEQIRELKLGMSIKISTGDRHINRIAVINSAEKCTHQAQNALLKLLEEPVNGHLIIIMTNNANSLLQTIRSRCQLIKVLPLKDNQLLAISKDLIISNEKLQIAQKLSSNKAKLFIELVSSLVSEGKLTENAKTFLSSNVATRISQSKEFSDSVKLNLLLEEIELLSQATVLNTKKSQMTKRWLSILKEVRKSKKLLIQSVNPKLVYLRICVNI